MLPATSVQLEGTEAEPPSGPEYVTAGHPPTPERLSVAVKLTLTAWLYQPFESGARPGTAPVIDGGVLSYLKAGDGAVEPFPATSRQVMLPDVEALSGPEYELEHGSGPETPSLGVATIPTGSLYQPA